MLELRPSCEHCNKALSPNAVDARICSFECTFCAACVELLGNVCPNCGGGFAVRPIRPSRDWKNGNYLGRHPPTAKVTLKPVDLEVHAAFSAEILGLGPEDR